MGVSGLWKWLELYWWAIEMPPAREMAEVSGMELGVFR
jgi:hypothetical protein